MTQQKKYFLNLTGDKLNLAAIILIVMPAVMTFGYNQSLVGGLLDFKAFKDQFPQIDPSSGNKGDKTTLRGTVVALYAVGGIFGSIACAWLGDTKGRRHTLFVAAIFQIVGSVLMATSYSLAQFIVSRIIVGLGTGGVLSTVSVWQAEISNSKRRGSHVTFIGVFLGLGLCLSLWIDYGFYRNPGQISFRFPFGFQIVLSLFIVVFIFMFPESPRFLMKKQRHKEAQEVMLVIEDGMVEPEEVLNEVHLQQISIDLAGKTAFWDVIRMGPQRTLHRTILAVSCLVGLQLTGVNAITLYTSTIFSDFLKLDANVAKPLAAVYQMTSIFGGWLAAYTVERYGRRTLMIVSALANMVTMAFNAALLSYPDNIKAIRAGTFFVYAYHLVYVIGWGGVPFLYASEIAPLAHRATINGFAVAGFWAFNFMIAEVSPTAYSNIHAKYLIVWTITNALLALMVYFFYPETSGRTLEEIDQIFASCNGWLDAVHVARRMPKGGISSADDDLESCKPTSGFIESVSN